MDPMFSEALQYIHQVQTKLTGDGRQIYAQFIQILKQFRHGSIDSSIVISIVQKLFRSHPDLLDAFKPFAPTDALPPDGSGMRVYVDFVNRVRTRFGGGEVYCKFSSCMHAYSRAEISAAEVCDEVVGLLGDDDDLVVEFMRFVPEFCVRGEGSKKRKIIDRDHDHDQSQMQQMGKRRRGSDSGSLDDLDVGAGAGAAPTRWRFRKSGDAAEKAAAKKILDRDNDMEDSLCDIDVRIGNLESIRRKVVSLAGRLRGGRLSPVDVRADEVFTPLNLGFIRKLDRKILGRIDQHMLHGLGELMEILMRKNASLEKERLRILQKWNNARKSDMN